MARCQVVSRSSFVVGTTSLVSVISHARKGRVKWRTGLVFGAASMVGAFGGGLLGGHIPGTLLMIAFALMMVATSLAMIRGRKNKTAATHNSELPVFKVIIEGLIVGLVTGLVTNFHLPRSTLLMLVSAFAGPELTAGAYRHAVAHRYRFYSYGDASLLLP